MRKRKIILLIFVISGVMIILCYFLKNSFFDSLYEDIWFLKENNKKIEKEEKNVLTYEINLDLEEKVTQSIFLANTLEKKEILKEMIAPGVKGQFNISLKTKQDCYYQLKCQSKNDKPKNLVFYVENISSKETLEELDSYLLGKIDKNQQKVITIYWEWLFDSNNDKQDTKDAQAIREYEFTISALAEKKKERR